MSIDRSELVTLLRRKLKGTHVLAVPLADSILELADETPPVPPLPTIPRTSITVTYTNVERNVRELEREDWVLLRNGLQWMSDDCELTTAEGLTALITAFEVLAEPVDHERAHGEKMKAIVRRETAAAILDRIHKAAIQDTSSDYRRIHIHDLIDIARDWNLQ